MKNWKTTLTGLLSLLPMALHIVFPTVITAETAMKISGVLTSLGLIGAKDHDGE